MSFSSDEVNLLIFQYLQESGFQHSAYTFASESKILQSSINPSQVLTAPACLINILQKGLQYAEVEIIIGNEGNVVNLPEKISLIDAARPDIIESRKNDYNNRNKASSESIIVDPSNDEIVETTIPIEIPPSSVRTLRGHTSQTFLCTWNPLGNFLASGSGDSTARIWDISDVSNNNEVIFRHCLETKDGETPINKEVTCLDWNCDGKHLAMGTYDGHARIWTTESSLACSLGQHDGPIFALKWNKNGRYLLSGGTDHTVRIWDAKIKNANTADHCVQEFRFHSAPVLDVDWKTNTTFASCSGDNCIYVCRLNKKEPLKKFQGHTKEINGIEWDPQGKLLASCSDDTTLKIWSMKQDTFVHDFLAHSKEIYTVKWSPTGSGSKNPNKNIVLASASFDTTVRLWDVEKSSCVHTLTKHSNSVYSVSFSPDGKFLATGGFDKFVYVWSVESGELVRSFEASTGIFDVSWNTSGDRIAVGAADGCVFVLDFRKL